MIVFLIRLVVFLVAIFIIGLFLRTWQVQNSENQKQFLAGTVPNPAPEGFYKGSVGNYRVSWKGKSFNAKENTGSNTFGEQAGQYPFTTYQAKSLLNDKQVLAIDYNIPQNPWRVRIIVDEIVQVAPEKYFGKIFLKIIPGYPFAIGFFSLEK